MYSVQQPIVMHTTHVLKMDVSRSITLSRVYLIVRVIGARVNSTRFLSLSLVLKCMGGEHAAFTIARCGSG